MMRRIVNGDGAAKQGGHTPAYQFTPEACTPILQNLIFSTDRFVRLTERKLARA
jgi:hypothetical protein